MYHRVQKGGKNAERESKNRVAKCNVAIYARKALPRGNEVSEDAPFPRSIIVSNFMKIYYYLIIH
jgi:hypothetical protein